VPARLLISDANIIIDMNAGGLLRAMFRLEFALAVPDILFEEELRKDHPNLRYLGLQCLELDGETVEYAGRLVQKYAATGAGTNDLLALALAWQEECPLLTGDPRLRDAAGNEEVEVHGTLWLVEQMLTAGVIRPKRARQAYDAMRKAGRRLPWEKVEDQLRRFE
jgi:predicted nucleic acid-binding protein